MYVYISSSLSTTAANPHGPIMSRGLFAADVNDARMHSLYSHLQLTHTVNSAVCFCRRSFASSMTHQHGGNSSGGEEVKDVGQQSSSTVAAAPTQPTQCCVYFAPQEWSRRYGEQFYTARITAAQKQSDGSHSYSLSMKCGDSEWSMERPYSAFRQLTGDIAASYRAQPDSGSSFPPLPGDKADVCDMQSWVDGTLQRKDISRVAAVRQFLNLDIPTQHTQHEQQDDVEDEQHTAEEGEEGESKQTEAPH